MKKRVISFITAAVIALSFAACGNVENGGAVNDPSVAGNAASTNSGVRKKKQETETHSAAAPQVDYTNFVPSEGLEFESNGDGTCSIKGIGTCSDSDLVIPRTSPDGDTVTLIKRLPSWDTEDLKSITFLNCSCEIEKSAFQYSEIEALNFIGGRLSIKRSAFSSCEKLKNVTFTDCEIDIDENAFFGMGKDAAVSFESCAGSIDERAFQYGDIASLDISNSELEIEESVFSSCEDLRSITFYNSAVSAGENAFFGCGKDAVVEMTDCDIVIDDGAFRYSSLSSLTVSGTSFELGDSVFSSCEDLETVIIDCRTVIMGKNTFFGCDDLTSVSICDNGGSDNTIDIGEGAFQYDSDLETVIIGNGNIKIGKYAFSGTDDDISITVAGNKYSADDMRDGFALGTVPSRNKNSDNKTASYEYSEKPAAETKAASQNGIRPEFKAAMDSYEEFFDEYVGFMKRYAEADDPLSMWGDYFEYPEKYTDAMEKLGEIGDEDMSDEELKYYTEVMLRIEGKLLSAYT